MTVLCEVFRSPKEEGLYLYVKREEGLERVPEALLQRFGKPQSAMVLALTPERRLARVDRERLLACLEEPGYYVQLPPRPELDSQAQGIGEHNSKMAGKRGVRS